MAVHVNTPSDLKRAQTYESNLRAFARCRCLAAGGWVLKKGEVEVAACPFLDFVNGLSSPAWPEGRAAENLLVALRLFQPFGQGMLVQLGPSSPAAVLRELLLGYGFKCTYHVPYMHLDLKTFDHDLLAPRGIQVEVVDDFTVFDRCAHPWIGSATTDSRRSRLKALKSMCSGSNPVAWQYVAKRGDSVVGAALVYRYRKNVGFYDVIVVQSERKKGIGAHLMSVACRVAADRGFAAAGLGASGRRVGLYTKVEFIECGHYGEYFLSRSKIVSLDLGKQPR
jgi:GNAT superfamily N-acetyltransferase